LKDLDSYDYSDKKNKWVQKNLNRLILWLPWQYSNRQPLVYKTSNGPLSWAQTRTSPKNRGDYCDSSPNL
jgi:hypothetical protein